MVFEVCRTNDMVNAGKLSLITGALVLSLEVNTTVGSLELELELPDFGMDSNGECCSDDGSDIIDTDEASGDESDHIDTRFQVLFE